MQFQGHATSYVFAFLQIVYQKLVVIISFIAKKIGTTAQNAFHASASLVVILSSSSLHCSISRTCGPVKIPAFFLASDKKGNRAKMC